MKRFISNKFTIFFLGVVFVVIVWLIGSLIFDKNGAIFPSPALTMQSFGEILGEKKTYVGFGYTFLRMLIGFGFSFILALIFGIIAGNHQKIYQFFKPLMIVFKSIPTVALVFVLIVMSNARDAPIYVVLVICFPILYEGIVGGIKSIDPFVISASKVDGTRYLKSILKIKVPLALPYIIVAVVSSFALSFKIEIMAEVVTGATKNGLGSSIQNAYSMGEMSKVFAYSFLVIIFMLLVTLIEEVTKQVTKRESVVKSNNN